MSQTKSYGVHEDPGNSPPPLWVVLLVCALGSAIVMTVEHSRAVKRWHRIPPLPPPVHTMVIAEYGYCHTDPREGADWPCGWPFGRYTIAILPVRAPRTTIHPVHSDLQPKEMPDGKEVRREEK